jgi:hypothetical protein
LIFDVADIVALLSVSDVADNACEFVLIVWMFLRQAGIILLFSFVILIGEGVDVEFSWKLMFICYFLVDEGI